MEGKLRSCEAEFQSLYGSNWRKRKNAPIIWSIGACYELKDLIDKGLVKQVKEGEKHE